MESNQKLNPLSESEEINKAIALELMNEVLRGKDINTLFSRDKILQILEKIKEDGYYQIHQSLSGSNQLAIYNFNENKAKLFKSLLKEIPNKVKFDIEIIKFGKKLNKATRRWGILIKEEGFFSSKTPKYNPYKCKDKTEILLDSTMICQQKSKLGKDKDYDDDEDDEHNLPDWHSPKKDHRIVLEYTDETKKSKQNYICLYFENSQQLGEAKEIVFGMKSEDKTNNKIVTNLKSLEKMIESSYLFYGVFKILEMRSRVTKRKLLLQELKLNLEDSLTGFNQFGRYLFRNIADNYLQSKKCFVRNKKSMTFPKYKILYKNFPYNNYDNNNENVNEIVNNIELNSASVDNYNFVNISELKSNVDLIVKKFPQFFNKKLVKSKKEKINPNKAVAFKIQQADCLLKKLDQNQNIGRSIPALKSTFKTQANSFTIDKQKLEISFNDGSRLNQTDLLKISSVFQNFDLQSNYNENFLTLNGPKIDPKKFFKYFFRSSSALEKFSNQIFIEPEYHSLCYNQSNHRYKALNIQIFHSIFVFEKKDIEYLEYKSFGSGSRYKYDYENPLDDFYFFIQICLNNTNYKMRTKLMKAKKYIHNQFIIEFNLSHSLNLDSLEIFHKNLEMKVSLNLVPAFCFKDKGKDLSDFSEGEMNFYVDYLKPYEIGFCLINTEKITKREYNFPLLKEEKILSDENKIIMNFFIDENEGEGEGQGEGEGNIAKSNPNSQSLFYGKEFNIGNDIFALEELDKKFFLTKMNDNTIDPNIKEKFYNIKFSQDNCILLRVPDSITVENFSKDTKKIISEEELKKMLHNKNFAFIPYCEKFISKTNLLKNMNISYNVNEILDVNNPNLNPNPNIGDWIYKVKNIKKFFLSNFKGITEKGNFVYHNYFTNEIRSHRIVNPYYDVKKKFRPVQENLFGVYDFSEIDPDKINQESNSNNFLWKIGVKFINASEMKVFIFFLKDLRRRANLQAKKAKLIIDSPINVSTLTLMTRNLIKSLRSLRVSVEAIEFRQKFNLKENKKLTVKISKCNMNNQKQSKYLLESLDESEDYQYQNSLMSYDEINRDISTLQNFKKAFQFLPKAFDLNMATFNKSQKILDFPKEETEENLKTKTFMIEVIPRADKLFAIEITLTGKTFETFTVKIDLDDLINLRPQADKFILPFCDSENRVKGILNLSIWAYNTDSYNAKFDDLFESCLKKIPLNLKDEHGNFLRLGRFEPNVHKRLVLKRIQTDFGKDIDSLTQLQDQKDKELLHSILKEFCIKNFDDLEENNSVNVNVNANASIPLWLDLTPDMKLLKFNLLKKFYSIKKRNDFYSLFSKSEWTIFLRKIFNHLKTHNLNYKKLPVVFENIDMYSVFPSKEDIIIIKNKQKDVYSKLRFLYYIGLPQEGRLTVWERILDIEKLVTMTKMRMQFDSEKGTKEVKNDIYKHFERMTQNNSKFNINFSLIDNDINFLLPISESRGEVLNVKNIAKAFYLWSELNIVTDEYIKGPGRKFVYFFGLLKIIQRLFSVFKSESVTFWIIIGLSQIIELFYQSDPLQTNELTYNKMYVLISKLIMENNLRNLYSKILELGFPIEYFLAKLIPTLFSDVFHTELFLRLLDIIIFEAALKTNEFDQYDYIRVICTIPLTLLKTNEDKLIQCRSVRELEVVFEDLNFESFNIQKFLENVRENVDKFYEMKNMFHIMKIHTNKDLDSRTWDDKRKKIEVKLCTFFEKVYDENKLFLKSFSKNKISPLSKFTDKFEDEVRTHLHRIRKVFSTGTPDAVDLKDENMLSLLTGTKHGIYYSITEFFSFNHKVDKSISKPDELLVYIEYDKSVINFSNFNFKSRAPTSIIKLGFNSNKNKVITQTRISKQFFQNALPKYMTIFLLNKEKSLLVGQYSINIIKLDLMRPHKIKLESIDKVNKTVIEICLFKYSLEKVSDEESNLYNFLFKEPNYIYDNNLNKEIDEVQVLSEKEVEEVNKIFSGNVKENLQKLKKEFKVEENFIYREYEKHFGLLSHIEKPPKQMKDILESIFNNNEKTSKLVTEWLKTNESSFEEILYAIILVDPSSLTIYEKLQLLFDVARTQNYLIHNEDKLTVPKLKELVYSLYKRYMVYFTKSDVDRLVDYILNKENLCNFKYAVLYNDKKCKEVENVINDKGHAQFSIIPFSNKSKLFVEVRKSIAFLIETLKNQFGAKNIPLNVITSLVNYICGNANVPDDVNEMRIELEVDKVKKNFALEVKMNNTNKTNNNDNSKGNTNITSNGKTYNMQLIDLDESIKTFTSSNNDSDNSDNCVFDSIIIDEAKSLEISNCNNNEISFDKFKDIFFTLPFISDLFRASCGFNHSSSNNEEFIHTLENVKVELSYPDRAYIRNFLFVKEDIEDMNNNSSNKNMVIFNMNSYLDSSVSIREVLEQIGLKIKDRPDFDELEVFFNNPKLITFLVKNKNRNTNESHRDKSVPFTGVEEKIRFFDPLYSNNYIRTANPKSHIELVFTMASTDDISRVNQKLIIKKSGFSKFGNVNVSDCCQWRECLVKEQNQAHLIRFKSLDNYYYFNVEENDYLIDEEC